MIEEYNDYELVSLAQEHNDDANAILRKKYTRIINHLSQKYYHMIKNGAELIDIIQECNIAFEEAIITFNDKKNNTFYSYVTNCMEKHLISIIRQYKREKHIALNNAISFEEIEEDNKTIDKYIKDETTNPERILNERDTYNRIYQQLIKELTSFEECVISLKIQNFNYDEIAKILDKDRKSIDNAIQRIKRKKQKINDITSYE